MSRPDLQPEGFEPELLAYFSAADLVKNAPRAQRALNTQGRGLPIQEYDRLTGVVAAFRQMEIGGFKIDKVEGTHIWSTTY